VTNAAFAAFAAATGYVTVAEHPLDPVQYPGAQPEMLRPGSLVFRMTDGPVDTRDYRNWWAWTPGACWRHPEGPGSDIAGREAHPGRPGRVRGRCGLRRLGRQGTADRGGMGVRRARRARRCRVRLGGRAHPRRRAHGEHLAGPVPLADFAADGFAGTCPVRSFPPNGHGLYEMCGNVWEWTTDWFASRHRSESRPTCKPNILMIMGRRHRLVEHQHYNRGMMGYRTPNIDRIAREGADLHRLLRAAELHRRPRRLHHRPVPVRTGLTKVGMPGAGRPAEGRPDHRRTAEAARLRHRPVRQEPPGRQGRVPADGARLRRVLRQPLPPQRRGRAGKPRLPEGPRVPKRFGPRGVIHSLPTAASRTPGR
jgi:hypothetical protein